MEEGLRILELMQSIKNVYIKADMEDKAKILRLLLQNCTLKGVNIRFYWNSPFDLLIKLGQTNKRGRLLNEVRTFLRHFSIAPLIQQLSQLAA